MSNTGFRNGKLFCYNCGTSGGWELPMPIDDANKAMKKFIKDHKKCPKTWVQPEPDMNRSMKYRIGFWMVHGEHGLSSDCIIERLYYKGKNQHHPHNVDDFSRCYFLLQWVPELDISGMKNVSKEWEKLVEIWPELTNLYEQKEYKKVNDLIYECIRNI